MYISNLTVKSCKNVGSDSEPASLGVYSKVLQGVDAAGIRITLNSKSLEWHFLICLKFK